MLLNRVGGSATVSRIMSNNRTLLYNVVQRVRRRKGYPRSVVINRKTYPLTLSKSSDWKRFLLVTTALCKRYPADFVGAFIEIQAQMIAAAGRRFLGNTDSGSFSAQDFRDTLNLVQECVKMANELLEVLGEVMGLFGASTTTTTPPPIPEVKAPVSRQTASQAAADRAAAQAAAEQAAAEQAVVAESEGMSTTAKVIGGVAVVGLVAALLLKRKK